MNINPVCAFVNALTPDNAGGSTQPTSFPNGLSIGASPYQTNLVPDDENLQVISQGLLTIFEPGGALSYTQISGGALVFYNPQNQTQYEWASFFANKIYIDYISRINGNFPVSSGNIDQMVIFQGVNTDTGGGMIAVTLPGSFGNTNYTVLATRQDAQPTNIPWVKVNSTTQFDIACDANATIGWVAVGYIPPVA